MNRSEPAEKLKAADGGPVIIDGSTPSSGNHITDITIDLAGTAKPDDFNFLLSITPTYLAQFDFLTPVNSGAAREQFIAQIWQAQSTCIRISNSFFKFLGLDIDPVATKQPIKKVFPDSPVNCALIGNWYDSKFSAKPIKQLLAAGSSDVACLEYAFHGQFENGKLKKLWIVARDITTLNASINRLSNAEEHYRTLVERPGIVLARSTCDGKLLYISPMVESFIGLKAEELIADPQLISQIVHPDDLTAYYGLLQARSNRRANKMEAEFRVRYKDGAYRWIYERQHPKLDQFGNVEYYDSIILDINERKQLEQQLLHAQRMETLGLSVGGIAHDFNNYLAAISGQIELAVDELRSSFQDCTQQPFTHLTLAQQAVLNCSAMARRLLSFSKKTDFLRSALDTSSLLNETSKLLGYSIPSRIAVQVDIDHDVKAINGNKVELQQVLVNLGLNARDAISESGTITLSASNHNNYVRLRVKDSGSGISPGHLPHIFDPYFTTKAEAGGSGLGLNLAYTIVRSHGGEIKVKSTIGVGTEIIIDLPSTNEKPPPPSQSSNTSIARGSETVLVVDDDPLILSMLRSALTSYGYKVLTAGSATEATESFLSNRASIDLVILDYSMKGASGDSVLKEIYNCDEDFPLLLSSGYGENLFNIPVGARRIDFIAKPYPIAELMQTIRNLLSQN